MNTDQNRPADKGRLPEADTGNASNPSPENNPLERVDTEELFNPKADTYIRESGNIEDVPDARDQQNSDDEMAKDRTKNK
ncbi:MAG TPA: hypothetical protein VNS32_03170 [Flavisolibacter sp.]|nr:hypothetical protein [Flavisolibacter sp.]